MGSLLWSSLSPSLLAFCPGPVVTSVVGEMIPTPHLAELLPVLRHSPYLHSEDFDSLRPTALSTCIFEVRSSLSSSLEFCAGSASSGSPPFLHSPALHVVESPVVPTHPASVRWISPVGFSAPSSVLLSPSPPLFLASSRCWTTLLQCYRSTAVLQLTYAGPNVPVLSTSAAEPPVTTSRLG